ncbi:MAG: hypothetical protein ABJA69_07700, partial [Acidobacteriaceae bacterium]
GIGERWTEDLYERIKTANNLSVALHGMLYTIEVKSTLCREGDFRIQPSSSSNAPRNVYVFLPSKEPFSVDGHFREEFLTGQSYLLFLVPLDKKTLDSWTTTYALDPKRPYFRGEQLARGVVPIKRSELGVLEKVTRLCEAVRPVGAARKLAALKKLEESGDPVLAKEARAAAENLLAEKGK